MDPSLGMEGVTLDPKLWPYATFFPRNSDHGLIDIRLNNDVMSMWINLLIHRCHAPLISWFIDSGLGTLVLWSTLVAQYIMIFIVLVRFYYSGTNVINHSY